VRLFDTWLNLVGNQVDSFLFVSLTPLEAKFLKTAPYPLVLVDERVVHGLIFAEFKILNHPVGQPGVQ
jgi:hypothetical protein